MQLKGISWFMYQSKGTLTLIFCLIATFVGLSGLLFRMKYIISFVNGTQLETYVATPQLLHNAWVPDPCTWCEQLERNFNLMCSSRVNPLSNLYWSLGVRVHYLWLKCFASPQPMARIPASLLRLPQSGLNLFCQASSWLIQPGLFAFVINFWTNLITSIAHARQAARFLGFLVKETLWFRQTANAHSLETRRRDNTIAFKIQGPRPHSRKQNGQENANENYLHQSEAERRIWTGTQLQNDTHPFLHHSEPWQFFRTELNPFYLSRNKE